MKSQLFITILFSFLIIFMSCKEKVKSIESIDSKISEAPQEMVVKSSAGGIDTHYKRYWSFCND